MDAAVTSEFPPRALIRERRDSRGTRAKRIDFSFFMGWAAPSAAKVVCDAVIISRISRQKAIEPHAMVIVEDTSIRRARCTRNRQVCPTRRSGSSAKKSIIYPFLKIWR